MASKAKKLVSHRRPASSKVGEGSRAPAERRTKHRDDRLPELVVPPHLNLTWDKGSFTKFVQPQYVDFTSLADLFPNLQPLFDTQGWTVFLYSHTVYSPSAVSEFFNNLGYSEDYEFYTSVKGTPFKLTANLFSTALQIPNSGADILTHHPSASEYYQLITLQPYDGTKKIAKLNANSFPPLNRMIHHIFTTLIAPKHGSRELVTVVHKSLFTFFLKCEQINLPALILGLIRHYFYNPRRSMPYACPITSVLRFIGINILDSECVELNSPSSFDLTAAHRMGYKQIDGVVTQELKGKAPAAAMDEDREDDEDDDDHDEEADEDSQSEPLDAPGDDVSVAASDSLLAQLQLQMSTGFDKLHACLDTMDTSIDALVDTQVQLRFTRLSTELFDILWAYSTPGFSICECDSRGCRVLNATLLPVAFLLPLCGADHLHVRHVLGAGRTTDVSLRKATPKTVAMRSRWNGPSRGGALRVFRGILGFGVFSLRELRVKRGKHREIVGLCVLRGGSTTPTVVTSPVGCPRFSVSQAVSLGLVSVLVLYRRVTSEAHPYSPQAKVKRKFRYRIPVRGRVAVMLGQRLQKCSFCWESYVQSLNNNSGFH
ncbi:hypothetical protein Taro_051396 [Colocasia esculenta]|uniref:Uncharacterized protein n=1 Tax=Colocasia esculenta TaxID=4460 RepID=A0A843XGV3_COLES|nr:hypothetical protein [Colocasia esculenta]